MGILVMGILYVVYPVQKRHCIRSNSIWHMYYLEQNLLLSTNDNNSVLKIADFGFARSLQPRGLAETLCGSPLYMAPEIMQLQKYDANEDLWSVCVILFQLVTGRTPFTGNNHIQLLQNIVKYSELHFPPDNNDLSGDCKDLCQKLMRRNLDRGKFSEDCMSFPLDDDSSGAKGSPSFLRKRSSMRIDSLRPSDENVKEPLKSMEQRPMRSCSRVVDSLEELVDQDYVFVSGPPMDVSSSSAIASKPRITNTCYTGSLESHSSTPSGTSQGSMDIGDALEQPSTHCMTRIKSLQQCASVIIELVQKMGSVGRKAQVGKWCMWIMRMMYFLLGMIPGNGNLGFIRGSSSILATLGVHSLKLGLGNLGAEMQMALA
ncbi:Serine/threonine-protein kinase ATG1c [Vitis vinifera]|uniref:Serine/threonine-protein kinase ATG1c n=1 Tax=Vitis vinifera TaxID=29760 RepID=A0A438I2J0_VITVI|nr:Serine/threonine-protein kinase ATG1c [Vitis vinifera]